MAKAGYSLLVRRGSIPVSTSAEPTSVITLDSGATAFQITSAARRVINPNNPSASSWHVKNNTTTLAFSTLTAVDYVNGTFQYNGGSAASFTFTGFYVPITTASDTILEARDFTLTDSNDVLDTTVFTGTTDRVRRKIPGLNDVDLSVETLARRADLAYLATLHHQGSPVVTEIYFGDAAHPRFRGFCKIESIETSGSVEDLLSTQITFKIAAVHDTVPNQVASYNYTIHANT